MDWGGWRVGGGWGQRGPRRKQGRLLCIVHLVLALLLYLLQLALLGLDGLLGSLGLSLCCHSLLC